MRIELSNIRKKSKEITKYEKRTVTCDIGIAQCGTVKCEKKNKGTTKCEKRIVAYNVGTT